MDKKIENMKEFVKLKKIQDNDKSYEMIEEISKEILKETEEKEHESR